MLLLISFSEVFVVLERFGGVRQCWEQERTTCSGGWVNANNCGNPQMLKMCKYCFLLFVGKCFQILCIFPYRMGGLGGFPMAPIGTIF